MSYQVLARKWRPRNFHEMVGQEHVLTALVNALDHDRLHHAYLFTGTRGVGKTTIARIFAKCLNCESGISSNPCGDCSACREIAEGRFVDLIEVDAASRTKVEDTRELLDNVQYAPTRGRFKVYLIDEVHMLSGHSFNALLKTLEEPPPHVKFLLATTDPQKLPVTILSRCLQFHLKNMSQERIVSHLSNVLTQEALNFEQPALWQLARAADGSMRDALSLTDQAIAFGNGSVSETQVSAMLGTIDQTFIHDILSALASLDGPKVLAAVAAMSEQSPDYAGALADIIGVLHRIAIAQAVPSALDNSLGDLDQVMELAAAIASEDVQLFYQIALHGRKDLAISPDPRTGFEMVLLRMLAFKPQGVSELPKAPLPAGSERTEKPSQAPASPVREPGSQDGSHDKEQQAQEPQASQESQAPQEPKAQTQQPQVAAPKPEIQKPEPATTPAPESNSEPTNAEPATGSIAAQMPTVEEPEVPETSAQDPAVAQLDSASSSHPAFDQEDPGVDTSAEDAYFASAPDTFASPVEPPQPEQAVAGPKNPKPEALQAEAKPAARPAHTNPTQTAANPGSQSDHHRAQANSQSERSVEIEPKVAEPRYTLADLNPSTWLDIYPQLKAAGVLQSTVSNCVFRHAEGQRLHFDLDESNATLYNEDHQGRFADLLSEYFGETVQVTIALADVHSETPAARAVRLRNERHAQAVQLVQTDPFIQRLVTDFAVELDPEKIEPTL